MIKTIVAIFLSMIMFTGADNTTRAQNSRADKSKFKRTKSAKALVANAANEKAQNGYLLVQFPDVGEKDDVTLLLEGKELKESVKLMHLPPGSYGGLVMAPGKYSIFGFYGKDRNSEPNKAKIFHGKPMIVEIQEGRTVKLSVTSYQYLKRQDLREIRINAATKESYDLGYIFSDFNKNGKQVFIGKYWLMLDESNPSVKNEVPPVAKKISDDVSFQSTDMNAKLPTIKEGMPFLPTLKDYAFVYFSRPLFVVNETYSLVKNGTRFRGAGNEFKLEAGQTVLLKILPARTMFSVTRMNKMNRRIQTEEVYDNFSAGEKYFYEIDDRGRVVSISESRYKEISSGSPVAEEHVIAGTPYEVDARKNEVKTKAVNAIHYRPEYEHTSGTNIIKASDGRFWYVCSKSTKKDQCMLPGQMYSYPDAENYCNALSNEQMQWSLPTEEDFRAISYCEPDDFKGEKCLSSGKVAVPTEIFFDMAPGFYWIKAKDENLVPTFNLAKATLGWHYDKAKHKALGICVGKKRGS